MQFTRLNRDGDLAVLILDHPPVNALSQAVRVELSKRIKEVAADERIKGLILACAGRTFIAGADISELGESLEPSFPDLIAEVESLLIPTVAAIFGTALGGGFEIALGCTYRVAAAGARVGLPEVNLGMLPGAGGTVRATILAGPMAVLDLAGSGKPIRVEDAHAKGLVDAIIHGDLLQGAKAFLIERIAEGGAPLPTLKRQKAEALDDWGPFEALADTLARKARSCAPNLVAQSVRYAATNEPRHAMEFERSLYLQAVDSAPAAARRYLFLAERAAAKPPEDIRDCAPRSVCNVGIVGAGTMGSGIAMAFANSGFDVALVEVSKDSLNKGMERIKQTYAKSVARGTMSQSRMDEYLLRIRGDVNFDAFADRDLIVEAAFEDMDVKKDIFERIDAVAPAHAILATNTSYLDVDQIAQFTKRSDSVIGMHFFSPANVMKLLEIIRGKDTAPAVIATAVAIGKTLKKQPVVVGVCHGFVGNRMFAARNAQLSSLLLEGARPSDIDAAFLKFGWSMGPCAVQDLAGLDIGWRNRKALGKTDPLSDRLCELGRLGQKTGKGWYLYEDGRTPKPDPEVDAIITDLARCLGIQQRAVTAQEIVDRTHGQMIEEGCRILDEGIAERSSDIDVIWTSGYGFPRDLGGPMYWDAHGRPAAQSQ